MDYYGRIVILSFGIVNILPIMALEAEENFPTLCSAINDYCPKGYYCSTTSHRCWPCHICGEIDILLNSIPTKCRCDGGKDGDPFLICSAFLYPGETSRGPLVHTLDDLASDIRPLFEHYFDGKYAEKNPSNCPYRTATTVSLTTEVETTTSGSTATHTSRYEATSSVLSSTSYFNTDNHESLETGMTPDTGFILAVAGVGTFSLALVLLLIYCRCRFFKPDEPINERVEVQQEREDDLASDHIGTLPFDPMLQSGSITEGEIIEELPLVVTHDTVTEFSNEILTEVTWTRMKPLLQIAFEDNNFKSDVLRQWLPTASEDLHFRLSIVSEGDLLYEAIKEQTDIFGVDTYKAVGGALQDRNLRNNFPSQQNIITQLIRVLAETDTNTQRYATGNHRQQPEMETIA